MKIGRAILKFILLLILIFIVYISNNFVIYALSYVLIFIYMSARIISKKDEWLPKILIIVIYGCIMTFQLVFNVLVTFDSHDSETRTVILKIFGALFITLPFIIDNFIVVKKFDSGYVPSVKDESTISFTDLLKYREKIGSTLNKLKEVKETITNDDIRELLEDLPRHNSFEYVNRDSLTPEYFERAYRSLDDGNIYLILSNTGTAASKVLSVFTSKVHNHVSLSFDRDLETIVSYNGGNKIFPPGMNPEMIGMLCRKKDSSIMIYSLPVDRDRKKNIIDKIAEINTNGSAYNMIGLILKDSFKPNILFCSQFVYKMLEFAGINYFERKDAYVKPTDLVELDYYRKLRFVDEIMLP